MLVVGSVATWLALSGEFGMFLHQRMRWPLALAGVVALGIGAAEVVVSDRRRRIDASGRPQQAAPVVGWLLMFPIVILMAVAPSALDSTAALRARGVVPEREQALYPDLSELAEPIPMRVYDFVNQAVWDPARGLRDRQVELEGFVLQDTRYPDGPLLVRFAVSCCAADGYPVFVALRDAELDVADDTWIRAVVQWRPPQTGHYVGDDGRLVNDGDFYIEADLVSFTVMGGPPDSPYEEPWIRN